MCVDDLFHWLCIICIRSCADGSMQDLPQVLSGWSSSHQWQVINTLLIDLLATANCQLHVFGSNFTHDELARCTDTALVSTLIPFSLGAQHKTDVHNNNSGSRIMADAHTHLIWATYCMYLRCVCVMCESHCVILPICWCRPPVIYVGDSGLPIDCLHICARVSILSLFHFQSVLYTFKNLSTVFWGEVKWGREW